MNKKTFIVVFIAALLAFWGAYLLLMKDVAEVVDIEDSSNVVKEEIIDNDANNIQIEEKQETTTEPENLIKPALNNEVIKVKEPAVAKKLDVIKEEADTVQVGGVIEEVEDYGVRNNEDGLVEITREFRMKSPRKYSFVDFGFLEKVTR